MPNYLSEMSLHQCMQQGNKHKELEICVQVQDHDLIAITETWWDVSHDWNAVIDGYISGKTGQQGKVVELLFMGGSNCNAPRFA